MSDTADTDDKTRRDFLLLSTITVGAVGTGLACWPLVDAMNPAADTLALSSVEVNVQPIAVGQAVTVKWRGKPLFIRHRTPEEIKAAEAVPLSELRDPQTDDERLVPMQNGELNRAILVTSGSCTHLGCVPVGPAQGNTGDFGGWYCPCHGSHYDTSGRIRRGPAPANLPVPDYNWVSPAVINISL